MNATEPVKGLGHRFWLDRITRDHLTNGTLQRYIDGGLVGGVSSNLTALADAIRGSTSYDAAIVQAHHSQSTEETFVDLALAGVTGAADLLRPLFDRTGGERGWASVDISPSLTADAAGTMAVAKDLFTRAGRPNLLIKIPGIAKALPAIEEAIFAGVPVHITLLYSAEQYFAAADAFLRGIERRIAAAVPPHADCVASLNVGRWSAGSSRAPADLATELCSAVAQRTYGVYRTLLDSPRWQRLANAGVRPHRLVWAGTATETDLRAPIVFTTGDGDGPMQAMPEEHLATCAGQVGPGDIVLTRRGGWEDVLAQCERTGVNVYALAARFQDEGLRSLLRSWEALMAAIRWKSATLARMQ